MLTARRPIPVAKALPKWQTANPLAGLIWTAYGGNPIDSRVPAEFEVVLDSGTYYCFWSDDTLFQTYCDSASVLNGPWTQVNAGVSLFNARYPTVMNDGGTWKAWANIGSGSLHYFTASSPGGTWTDQGVAITPPGSGAYSAGILDARVRKMPDTTYIMAATDSSLGSIGYWTSSTAANGSWTLARFPLLDYSLLSEGPRRSDPCPFIASNGNFVITYSSYPGPSQNAAQPGGMAIYDPTVGGFVVNPNPMMSDTAGSGHPSIYEFSAGVYTLCWVSAAGGLNYATSAAGPQPWVQRTWDGTVEP